MHARARRRRRADEMLAVDRSYLAKASTWYWVASELRSL